MRTGQTLLCVALLASPWFFGAWEMWWFWPFAVLIFLATLFFGLGLLARAGGSRATDTERAFLPPAFAAIGALPFLLYAVARSLRTGVFMDAERSALLHLTFFFVAIHVVFGADRGLRRLLWMLLAFDLLLLGLYGIVNHLAFGSRRVLWVEGFPQYQEDHRATGSYFCPDHYSGIMELAFALALGLLLDRRSSGRYRMLGVLLAATALWGVVISKSRGGGMTVVVMSGAALVWGLRQWPRTVRWWWRLTLASTAGIALIVFSQVAGSYMSRFLSYFQWEKLQHLPPGQMVRGAWDRYRDLDRGQMAAAALRAWKATGPAFGIGPGMHKNLWPHFAASPDGDREAGRWPSSPNNTHYSFEAHNDWVQLLEEYGLAGLALFLLPVSIAFAVLRRGLVAVRPDRPAHRPAEDEPGRYAVMLGGMLAGIGMGFHSLGDFNLQIPATTWLLAAILAAALADAGELRMRRIERRRMEDKS